MIMSATLNDNKVSHEDYVYKKEAKAKWTLYWVRLQGKFMKFYESETSEKIIGSVEIGSKTKCVVSKRKTYSFPFMVCAAHGRHLLKCESAARRHRWMKAIHHVVELLRYGTTNDCVEENNLRIEYTEENKSVGNDEYGGEVHEDDLPPNVIFVASLPAACESPSLPFKLQNRRTEEVFDDDDTEARHDKTLPQHKTIVYPFTRSAHEESVPKITELERKKFSSLNIWSHLSLDSASLAPRVRSFPTTPESGARPSSPLMALNTSYFGKSRSLSSLTSSHSRNDMRFSRHMVNGDCVDLEM